MLAHRAGGWYPSIPPPPAQLGFDVPPLVCPFCSALTTLPDAWPHPGFTCCVCHRPVPFAPDAAPHDDEIATHDPANLPQPDFLPIVPPRPWSWTPWFVFLLGAAIIGSVVADLVTQEVLWVFAIGIPALALLGMLAVVWVIFGDRRALPLEDVEEHEDPPPTKK